MLPFSQEDLSESAMIRTFTEEVPDNLLKWHWDAEDRTIEVLENSGWQFQRDNELPIDLEGTIEIPKGQWHRIIKGTGTLKLKIAKH